MFNKIQTYFESLWRIKWFKQCTDSWKHKSDQPFLMNSRVYLSWKWQESGKDESGRRMGKLRVRGEWESWEWQESGKAESGRRVGKLRVAGEWESWEWDESGKAENGRKVGKLRVAGEWESWEWESWEWQENGKAESGRRVGKLRVAGEWESWEWEESGKAESGRRMGRPKSDLRATSCHPDLWGKVERDEIKLQITKGRTAEHKVYDHRDTCKSVLEVRSHLQLVSILKDLYSVIVHLVNCKW